MEEIPNILRNYIVHTGRYIKIKFIVIFFYVMV